MSIKRVIEEALPGARVHEFEVPPFYANRKTGVRCVACDKIFFIGEVMFGVKPTYLLERLFPAEILKGSWCRMCMEAVGDRFKTSGALETDDASVEAFWASELMGLMRP